jgi:hypothetical protein
MAIMAPMKIFMGLIDFKYQLVQVIIDNDLTNYFLLGKFFVNP